MPTMMTCRLHIAGVVLIAIGMSACAGLRLPAGDPAPEAPVFTGYSGESEFTSDFGDPMNVTFRWTSGTGQDPSATPRRRAASPPAQPDFRWCVTRSGGAARSGSDQCFDFDSVDCEIDTDPLDEFWRCSGTADLPVSLGNTTGKWYIRAEAPNGPKPYANSEARDFTWTLRTPELRVARVALDTDPSITYLALLVGVGNTGPVAAENVRVRFDSIVFTDQGGTTTTTLPDVVLDVVPAATSAGESETSLLALDWDEDSAQPTIKPEDLGVTKPYTVVVTVTVDPDRRIPDANRADNTASGSERVFP